MNNKIASLGEWQPGQLLALSTMLGAGGFGGMRLLNEAVSKASPPSVPTNAIEVMLPALKAKQQEEELKQRQQASASAADGFTGVKTALEQPGFNPTRATDHDPAWMLRTLALTAGLPGGFLGAKWLYDTQKQNSLNSDIERKKQEYQNQLQQIYNQNQGKLASDTNTPLVDSFCEAIATELNKQAAVNPATEAQINSVMSNPYTSSQLNQEKASQGAADGLSFMKNMANKASLGMVNTGQDAAKLITYLSIPTVLGTLLYANAQKRKKEENAGYPTQVLAV